MSQGTIAQMTESQLKEMLESVAEATVEEKLLEILGDPEVGLHLRESVQDRLLRQMEAVGSGDYGRPLDDIVNELGLEQAVYEIRVQDSALSELAQMAKPQARRIVERIIGWRKTLKVRLDALTGRFSRLFKLRVGLHRVLYEARWSEKVTLVHMIGHRKDVYRR